MYKQLSIEEIYISTYKPLVKKFISKIEDVNCKGIPEPFFPTIGEKYEDSEIKIAFVGKETRGYGDLSEFIKKVNKNIDCKLSYNLKWFKDFNFSKAGNNFGNTFWDFIFKFLAKYHNIDNWKTLKNESNQEILKTFAWCNINSIEGFNITAKGNGVLQEDWKKVKESSNVFDSGQIMLDVLNPDIIIILNWTYDESWIFDENLEEVKRKEIEDHLYYYYLENTETHIIWTAHPTWLNKNKNFDDFVYKIVCYLHKKIKSKKT